jgi:hypothetical protein
MRIRMGCTVARRIADILLQLFVLVLTGFLLLVLVDLRGRYDPKITAVDSNRVNERNLALKRGFTSHPKNGAGAGAERARQTAVGSGELGPAQVLQEASKLPDGPHAAGTSNQGMSVALSADGNTALVGGPGPNNADRGRAPFVAPAGAAWIFTRSGSAWVQQGSKLVGATSAPGGGLWSQGASVALSADGNTAIVGGPSDDSTTGATWAFVRSSGVWRQQGDKLVGASAHRARESGLPLGQGMSVALSANGDTAIMGGWQAEGAWVFTRTGGIWSQQGKQLVGSGAIGKARQGTSVALSADGNTAIVGGGSDHDRNGAAWVFTRSGGIWSQQGKKLVGSGAVGTARQGTSVALSADGNTALIGGPGDNPWDRSVPFGLGPAGAAWVFTRTDGIWSQQGEKLVSPGTTGSARQGISVALSADGDVAIVGGLASDGAGSASVFTRSGGVWTQGEKLASAGAVGKSSPSVALSADGSVVLVGGSNDNGGVGAAWTFAQRAGHWIQEQKLVGAGEAGRPASSVPMSPEDGVTGRPNDNRRGAAAELTPSGGGFAQEPLLLPAPPRIRSLHVEE